MHHKPGSMKPVRQAPIILKSNSQHTGCAWGRGSPGRPQWRTQIQAPSAGQAVQVKGGGKIGKFMREKKNQGLEWSKPEFHSYLRAEWHLSCKKTKGKLHWISIPLPTFAYWWNKAVAVAAVGSQISSLLDVGVLRPWILMLVAAIWGGRVTFLI